MFNKKHKIGDTISKLRKEKGWTQNELAEKLQISDKAISKWESNKGDPSIEFLPMIAELFGVTIDYLMTGKEQEEKIVTMSKLELCAKKDDPSILEKMSLSASHTKDEDGNTLMYYIKKYESLKVLKTLIDNCSHQTHYMGLFPKNQFDLPELLLLIKIDRERIVLRNITTSNDTIRLCLDNLSSDSIWREDRDKIGISAGYKNIINYLVESFDKLTKYQQEYYFDLESSDIICKQTCWAYAYPYFIDEAYRLNKKLFKKLLDRVIQSNDLYNKKVKEMREASWIMDNFNKKYLYIHILPETVLYAIDNEDYDIANLLNTFTKNKIGKDVFEHTKINKNKKISESEKQKLLCIHEGILNIDEVLKLNDFKTIKKMLEDYPICYYEMLSNWLAKKKYKEIYKFAIDNNFGTIAADIKNGEYDDVKKELRYIKDSFYETNKYSSASFASYERDNYKHIDIMQNYINRNKPKPYEGLYNFTGVMADYKSQILYNVSLKLEKTKTTEGLNRKYFENEFAKGNYDIVIVKLCVKLEAILKCDYKYNGSFEEMLNKFCSSYNTTDDYGNDYDPYTPSLLNKLRQKRNNIVHSEINNVELSQSEIKECIDYICKLDKED